MKMWRKNTYQQSEVSCFVGKVNRIFKVQCFVESSGTNISPTVAAKGYCLTKRLVNVMETLNLSVTIVVVTILVFIFLNSFTYEEFKGAFGSGYEFGFALDMGSSIGIFLLLCILIGYLPSRRLFKKK